MNLLEFDNLSVVPALLRLILFLLILFILLFVVFTDKMFGKFSD